MVRFRNTSEPCARCVMGPHAHAVSAVSNTATKIPIHHTMRIHGSLPPKPAQAAPHHATLCTVLDEIRAYVEYQQSTGIDGFPRQTASPGAGSDRAPIET